MMKGTFIYTCVYNRPFKKTVGYHNFSRYLSITIKQHSSTDSRDSVSTYKYDGKLIKPNASKKSKFSDLYTSFLLPKGYPNSVHVGYKQFVIYQMLGMIMSSASGVLSMQSLLYGLGLTTSQGVIPLAATLNWILKDGIGQIGGVIFAGFINTQFDTNPKKWRMISTMCMDISSSIEMCIPLIPSLFLPMASLANIGKNISFLAASASRAAIHKSYAKHENLADVTAKTGSQSILSSTLGTALGISISTILSSDFNAMIASFITLTGLNIYFTYKSLTYVTMTTLTTERLDFLLYDYHMKYIQSQHSADTLHTHRSDLHPIKSHSLMNTKYTAYSTIYQYDTIHCTQTPVSVLTPEQMREYEILLSSPKVPIQLPSLHIGTNINTIITNEYDLQKILNLFQDESYLIFIETTTSSSSSSSPCSDINQMKTMSLYHNISQYIRNITSSSLHIIRKTFTETLINIYNILSIYTSTQLTSVTNDSEDNKNCINKYKVHIIYKISCNRENMIKGLIHSYLIRYHIYETIHLSKSSDIDLDNILRSTYQMMNPYSHTNTTPASALMGGTRTPTTLSDPAVTTTTSTTISTEWIKEVYHQIITNNYWKIDELLLEPIYNRIEYYTDSKT